MTWNTAALSTANVDSTSDNIASGLNELKLGLDRLNEVLTHPTSNSTSAMALSSQSVIQVAQASYTTWVSIPGSTGSNIIPLDDTIPQRTEGYGVLTLSFTPKSASSTIVLRASGSALCGGSALYDSAAAALFTDSTLNALQSVWLTTIFTAGESILANLSMLNYHSSGSTTARVYSLRVGPCTSTGTVILNGNSGSRLFGGTSGITLQVMEVL